VEAYLDRAVDAVDQMEPATSEETIREKVRSLRDNSSTSINAAKQFADSGLIKEPHDLLARPASLYRQAIEIAGTLPDDGERLELQTGLIVHMIKAAGVISDYGREQAIVVYATSMKEIDDLIKVSAEASKTHALAPEIACQWLADLGKKLPPSLHNLGYITQAATWQQGLTDRIVSLFEAANGYAHALAEPDSDEGLKQRDFISFVSQNATETAEAVLKLDADDGPNFAAAQRLLELSFSLAEVHAPEEARALAIDDAIRRINSVAADQSSPQNGVQLFGLTRRLLSAESQSDNEELTGLLERNVHNCLLYLQRKIKGEQGIPGLAVDDIDRPLAESIATFIEDEPVNLASELLRNLPLLFRDPALRNRISQGATQLIDGELAEERRRAEPGSATAKLFKAVAYSTTS
jgi:hypothetical protein